MPSRFFSYKTKNLVQYLVRDSVYRRTRDLLSLNTDPNYVKLYCEPFPGRLKDFKKAKNPVWKFFYFSKFIRMPLLISNEVETNLQFIEKEERYTFIKEFWEAGFDYTKTKRYHTFKKTYRKW